ncbi:MAG: hypothetical protein AVDCRST_MAG49-496, partial [uncultured Thermomicrobiales bacterium]
DHGVGVGAPVQLVRGHRRRVPRRLPWERQRMDSDGETATAAHRPGEDLHRATPTRRRSAITL